MDTVHKRTVQLVCGGDLMLGRGVNELVRRFGPAFPLEQLQPLLTGAWVCGNLECAISSEQRQYSGLEKDFYFRSDPQGVQVLREAGVRLVSLANNHALDADYGGLRETLKILKKNRIATVGAGENGAEAAAPRVIDVQRLRLAVVGACDHQRDFAATESRSGISIADPADAAELATMEQKVAQLARREDVDAVIVAWHWQSNWERVVRPVYRRAAQTLVDAGATVVWGHGPHHFQGVQRIGGAAVLYSTGGLVDDYATEPDYRNDRQLLFRLTLRRVSGQPAQVAAVRAHPIELGYGRPQPAGEEARRWIVSRFRIACEEVGTRVEQGSGGWLSVAASGAGGG